MKLNYILFYFNLSIAIISGYVLLINDLYLAALFLIFMYVPSIMINCNDKYSSFFYFFTSMYYMHRIPVIGLIEKEFWYDKGLFTQQIFSDTIIYLSIIFSLCGVVFYFIRNGFFNKRGYDIEVSDSEAKILRSLLYIYLIINFIVAIQGGLTVGYKVPLIFQPFIRFSQFLFPLTFLVFAPFFTIKDKTIFIIILLTTSLLAGSKAVIYNIFVFYLVAKLNFNDNRGKSIVLIGLLGLITGPLMFFIVNYIRYPELFEDISLAQYIYSSADVLFYAFSEVSHRFGGYFDTLVAFTVKHDLHGFEIKLIEYVYEIGAAINRLVPGDIFNVSNLYLPFEEKTAYVLRNTNISHDFGVGRHTESMAFARFYFMGVVPGAIVFIFTMASVYIFNFSKNIFLRIFLFYFTIDILAGGDIISFFLIPMNFLILFLIFKASKIVYFSLKRARASQHSGNNQSSSNIVKT